MYFNPTERCNLNCSYCYIPGDMRSKGVHMSPDTLLDALSRLKAHFAATLLAIMAPTARRLMCDISPCGGGGCFFAQHPNRDMFPCSEFIGLPHFKAATCSRTPSATCCKARPSPR